MSKMILYTIRTVEYRGGNQFDIFAVYATSFDDAWNRFWKYIDTLDEDDVGYIGCKADYFLYDASKHNAYFRRKDVKSGMITISHTNFEYGHDVVYIGGGYENN